MMFAPPVVAPRPHPRVVETCVGNSRVLMHLDERRLHFLNETATAIWETLGGSSTVEDLTLKLADRFDIEPAVVRTDVETMLARLRSAGLVTVNDLVSRVSSLRAVEPCGAIPEPAFSAGTYRALRANVAIECADAEAASVIGRILEPLRVDTEPDTSIRVRVDSDGRWTVTAAGGEPVATGSRLAAVLRTLAEVNGLAVASVRDHLVLHAAAVSGRGGAVVLPAASNSGKSTLATALVSHGLGYLSDEAAALGPDLVCMPYPKSIALDPGSFPLFPNLAPTPAGGLDLAVSTREWHIDPSSVGRLGRSRSVVAVVCPKWRPGAETRLCRVAPADAMQILLGESFDFAESDRGVFDILGRLVNRVPVFRLGYSDLGEAVEVVARLVDGEPTGIGTVSEAD